MAVIKKICYFMVIFSICFSVFSPTVYGTPPPNISGQAAILIDAKTGKILYDKKSSTRCAPASTTKILTAIIAIESGHLDENVTVSARAASTAGSSLYLYAGQIMPLRELVTGLLLRSGNDAAVAIAEYLAGSVDNFANIMNEKATTLGAYNSHFRNPHGLSTEGHYTTAFDLAWITRYALSNPVFADIVSTRETQIEWLDRKGNNRDRNIRNTNRLLWMFEDADGVKTGTTNEAGPCLVSSATRGNQKLIAVVLHDHSRWYDSMHLLKYGFDHYDLYEYAHAGDVLTVLPVADGTGATADILVADLAALVVNSEDFDTVQIEIDLPERLTAPLYKDQKVGELVFYVREQAVKTVDLIVGREIPERTVARIFFDQLIDMFRRLSKWGVL